MSHNFKENELIIYQNGDRFEIGRIKRLTEDGAFVYYHSGDTASKTPFDCMHKLQNAYCIPFTVLGGKFSKNTDFNREELKEMLNQVYGINSCNYVDTDSVRIESKEEKNERK